MINKTVLAPASVLIVSLMLAAAILVMSTSGVFGSVTFESTEMVSTTMAGTQGDNLSFTPVLSATGRYVAFHSSAANLVSDDTNGSIDIFRKDRQTGEIVRVSEASDGTGANIGSLIGISISANGSKVAFATSASNLVTDDTNGAADVFVKDLTTGVITRVSVDSSGTQANGGSTQPSISSNGNRVAFRSAATNLIGVDTNGVDDIYFKILSTGAVIRGSVTPGGTEADGLSDMPVIASDGGHFAFRTSATNLVSGDTNTEPDVMVFDVAGNTLSRASIDSIGTEGNYGAQFPSLSADGRYVAFDSQSSTWVTGDTTHFDIFRKDMVTGELVRVSNSYLGGNASHGSGAASLSPDGQLVAFYSFASDIVPGDTNGDNDVFVADLQNDEVARVSTSTGGTEGNGQSLNPYFAANGGFLAYYSDASNLVSGDVNGSADVFVTQVTVVQETCDGLVATVLGTTGDDTLDGTAGNDVILAKGGNDIINGLGGDDVICAGAGNDVITAGAGNDTVFGEGGNDNIFPGLGDDTVNGGPASDTINYSPSLTGVTVDITTGTADGEGTDTILQMEHITGSNFADILTGTSRANQLTGLNGADELNGLDGPDTLRGGWGNDILRGGVGNDSINGSLHKDTVDYEGAAAGVTLDLGAQTGFGEGNDDLFWIEIAIGSDFADNITGSSVANTLQGKDGDDVMNGSGGPDLILGQIGDDTLNGGDGNDTLTGGPGTDTLDGEAGGFDTCTGEFESNCEL